MQLGARLLGVRERTRRLLLLLNLVALGGLVTVLAVCVCFA